MSAPVSLDVREAERSVPAASDAVTLRTLIVLHAGMGRGDVAARLRRLPAAVLGHSLVEICVLTESRAGSDSAGADAARLTVLHIPAGLAYGDRQKLALDHARRRGADVILLTPVEHECDLSRALNLLRPVYSGEADLVLGDRFADGLRAAVGAMGWLRAMGNRLSAGVHGWLTGARHGDVHSAYRALRVDALRDIPFEENSPDRRFDGELLIQFQTFRRRIVDVAVPCCPSTAGQLGEGVLTALAAMKSDLRFFLHHKGFLYHSLFDNKAVPYQLRTDRHSVHHWVVAAIPPGSRVLDLGCSDGYVAKALREKKCRVVGLDMYDSAGARANTDEFHLANLEDLAPVARQVDFSRFDVVIALDVIEHLADPEAFLRILRANVRPGCQVILSTANVAYWIVRAMLLLGQFNYGKRGILDVTHKRLFTRATFSRICRVTGYQVTRVLGVPPPVQYVVPGSAGRWLTAMHAGMSRGWPSLFGFQIILHLSPRLTVEQVWKAVEVREKT